jgi:hypothetical protein
MYTWPVAQLYNINGMWNNWNEMHREKFRLHDLKNLNIILHEEYRCHFLYTAKSIQTIVCLSVYIHNLLYRNYYISYCCLCAELVQLLSIPPVHYIHNATSHNNNSHAIHTVLICIEYSCNWNEVNRQTANTKCRCIMV